MKAAVFDDGLRFASDHPRPHPEPGEVRLRTLLAGICNTDLEVVRGYANFRGVLGHEFVAVVEEAEDPSWVGQRVVGEINASCGVCDTCRAGRRTHCPHRTALGIRERDGALAECFCLPVENLHRVPDTITDQVAVFVEPLAAACQITDQVHVRPTDRVVVLGDGKLGLLVAQVLTLTGCDLLAIGRHPEKLDILAARGIPTRLAEDDPTAQADLVVECTGHAEGFQAARQILRPGGTLVLKSTYHGLVSSDLSQIVVDEIKIVGSRCGPFPAALHLLEQGLVEVEPLIEAIYPLDEVLAAFEHAAQRGALKVLVRPDLQDPPTHRQ
ncbi:MAG: MDR/zinc-dependent alcohol dehydrogenase-like family protein [Anaerolineae bacterium]